MEEATLVSQTFAALLPRFIFQANVSTNGEKDSERDEPEWTRYPLPAQNRVCFSSLQADYTRTT